jgi:ATP-dependent DNA ligase
VIITGHDGGAPTDQARVCLAALLWFETLEGTGVEGIVAKPLKSAYKAGRVWAKVRHADTVDATVSRLHRHGPAPQGAHRAATRRRDSTVPAT